MKSEEVIYEDNHLIVVNKRVGEIVQGDKTGDEPLVETLKAYIKDKYAKPGQVFLGVAHRIDRPVSGVCVFARTSKALSRLCDMFARRGDDEPRKTYIALVPRNDAFVGHNTNLEHWLSRNERLNKSFASDARPTHDAKARLASLDFDVLQTFDRWMLIEIHLHTGRHHQIRCQLAHIGLPIRGDIKYGAQRTMPDGSICLHAYSLTMLHPVRREMMTFQTPLPTWARDFARSEKEI